MKVVFFIAKRYFFSRHNTNAINIISFVSMLAVMVVTIAMLIIFSSLNGFEGLVKSLYSSFYPDISITAKEGKTFKIDDLKQAGCFDRIYISSDSDRAKQIAKEKGIDFIYRATEMCQSSAIWADVVEHIMSTIHGNPIVIWALATSPLFNRYTGR